MKAVAPDEQVPGTTVAGEAADAVSDLVGALRQLEGLTAQLGTFAMPSDTCTHAPAVVRAVCRELGIALTFDAPSGGRHTDHARVALAAELRRAQAAPWLGRLDPDTAAAAARRCYDEEDAGYQRHAIRRPDGSVVSVVAAGPRRSPCVLVLPPPGLSHRLALPWLKALRSRYRCLIPQSRGTAEPLGDVEDFDRRGCDMPQQVADLLAVTDALAPREDVHVMGLCGASGLAIAIAAQRPDRIRSLSVWHADLELGEDAAKTDHQINLRALVDLAGESRDTADWLRGKLVSGPMAGVPAMVGPLVVRPYATSELFYRYARLTAATVHWDCRATARALVQPCLVVTTADDATTHPDGSRRLAEIAPAARLVVAGNGDHLDAFRAGTEQVAWLESMLERA